MFNTIDKIGFWVAIAAFLGINANIYGKKLDLKIGLKILVLSNDQSNDEKETVTFLLNSLNSHGIKYDHIQLTKDGKRTYKDSLPMIYNKNYGKYYGIIFTTGNMHYKIDSKKTKPSLLPSQWNQIIEYQKKFQVRSLITYAYPTKSLGLAPIKGEEGNIPRKLKIIDQNLAQESGLNFNNVILENSWQYPAKIISKFSRPILTVTNSNGNEYPIGIIRKYSDQRETMAFMFSQKSYVTSSIALAHLWVKWLTKGVYIGKRRLYMGMQIDDFMLESYIWNPKLHKNTFNRDRIYRSTKEDLEFIISWQNSLENEFYNKLRLELTFNGGGIIDFAGKKDLLKEYMENKKHNFYWLNHTYSHPNLDKSTFKEAYDEFSKNNKFAYKYLSKKDLKYFSKNHAVTPEISGLFNKEVLKAAQKSEIVSLTGDNSRVELAPKNKYLGRYSTKKHNGVSGLFLMPRHATDIFWDTSTILEQTSEYNQIYQKEIGSKQSMEDILNREADKSLRNLLLLDPAPYMFHFPNIRKTNYSGKGTTLVTLWLEKAIKKLRKYTSLPLLNLKMEQIVKVYFARKKLDQCLKSAYISLNKKEFAYLTLKTKKDCRVPLTTSKKIPNKSAEIKYGPDYTYYIYSNFMKKVPLK